MAEKVYEIAKVNWKHNLFYHVLAAIVVCCLIPGIMGVKNLNASQTAQVMEMFIALLGIILFVPLFIPEQDKDIKDLLYSKKISASLVQGIRLVEAMGILCVFVCLYLIFLKSGNCTFEFGKLFYGTIASSIFLGGLGIVSYALFDNLPLAYMIPFMYYIMCLFTGNDYVKKLYVFSMTKGSIDEKLYILIFGVLFIIVGLIAMNKKAFI